MTLDAPGGVVPDGRGQAEPGAEGMKKVRRGPERTGIQAPSPSALPKDPAEEKPGPDCQDRAGMPILEGRRVEDPFYDVLELTRGTIAAAYARQTPGGRKRRQRRDQDERSEETISQGGWIHLSAEVDLEPMGQRPAQELGGGADGAQPAAEQWTEEESDSQHSQEEDDKKGPASKRRQPPAENPVYRHPETHFVKVGRGRAAFNEKSQPDEKRGRINEKEKSRGDREIPPAVPFQNIDRLHSPRPD
jgi:hypothetical protein